MAFWNKKTDRPKELAMSEDTLKSLQGIAHELDRTKNRLEALIEALKREKRNLR